LWLYSCAFAPVVVGNDNLTSASLVLGLNHDYLEEAIHRLSLDTSVLILYRMYPGLAHSFGSH
jgi:hypothetical protein